MLNFILQALFRSAQHRYGTREGTDPEPDLDPYLCIYHISVPLTNGSESGSGRPKSMRIRIPSTALNIYFALVSFTKLNASEQNNLVLQREHTVLQKCCIFSILDVVLHLHLGAPSMVRTTATIRANWYHTPIKAIRNELIDNNGSHF